MLRLTTEEFIKRSKAKYGNIFTYDNTEYLDCASNIIVTCKKHGDFTTSVNYHLRKDKIGGCKECKKEIRKPSLKYTTQEFIEKAKLIHGDKYDYSKTIYTGSNKKLTIICPIHGEFNQTPGHHIRSKYGCNKCNESQGERYIRILLNKYKQSFKMQYTFDDLVSSYKRTPYSFDFAIFRSKKDLKNNKLNFLIEFHGQQHKTEIPFFNEHGKSSIKIIKKRDRKKLKFCENNKIKLYVIWYSDNIQEKLESILVKHKLIRKKKKGDGYVPNK